MGKACRPAVIGCQHGLVQNWAVHWRNFHFDRLFVFGSHFMRTVPDQFKGRVVVAGLGKLDGIEAIPRPPFNDDLRPILFAAQTKATPELLLLLRRLQTVSCRPILIRPHPEYRDAFDGLRDTMAFTDVDEPLAAQMAMSSLLVTTGSTSVLEAIAAAVPVVVVPEERGNVYEATGLVLDRLDAGDILALATLQADPAWRARLDSYLDDVAGAPRSGRAALAAAAVERILGEPTLQISTLARN